MTQPNPESDLDLLAIAEQTAQLQATMSSMKSEQDALTTVIREFVASNRKQPEPEPEDLYGLDADHPLVKELKDTKSRLTRVESITQQREVTRQQQEALDVAITQLKRVAKAAGVDYSTIEASILALPPKETWWDSAMEIVEGSKKPETSQESPIRLFRESRRGGNRTSTFEEIEAAYGEGRISTEEYAQAIKQRQSR